MPDTRNAASSNPDLLAETSSITSSSSSKKYRIHLFPKTMMKKTMKLPSSSGLFHLSSSSSKPKKSKSAISLNMGKGRPSTTVLADTVDEALAITTPSTRKSYSSFHNHATLPTKSSSFQKQNYYEASEDKNSAQNSSWRVKSTKKQTNMFLEPSSSIKTAEETDSASSLSSPDPNSSDNTGGQRRRAPSLRSHLRRTGSMLAQELDDNEDVEQVSRAELSVASESSKKSNGQTKKNLRPRPSTNNIRPIKSKSVAAAANNRKEPPASRSVPRSSSSDHVLLFSPEQEQQRKVKNVLNRGHESANTLGRGSNHSKGSAAGLQRRSRIRDAFVSTHSPTLQKGYITTFLGGAQQQQEKKPDPSKLLKLIEEKQNEKKEQKIQASMISRSWVALEKLYDECH